MINYPPGIYKMTISGTVGTKSDSYTIEVEFVDPCPSSTISLGPSPISDTTYIIRSVE